MIYVLYCTVYYILYTVQYTVYYTVLYCMGVYWLCMPCICVCADVQITSLFYTLHVQEEYRSEGIDAAMVSYTDNRELLDLFLTVSAAQCWCCTCSGSNPGEEWMSDEAGT